MTAAWFVIVGASLVFACRAFRYQPTEEDARQVIRDGGESLWPMLRHAVAVRLRNDRAHLSLRWQRWKLNRSEARGWKRVGL